MSEFYCPTCHSGLEEHSSCGSVSYFCDTCKSLVSRSKILSKEAIEETLNVDEAEKQEEE